MVLEKPRPTVVAVIDDDVAARQAIARLLQVGGFDPALFDSAETFMASGPTGDSLLCVLADVHLAGMSGIELQRKLHGEGSNVPFIITTGDRAEFIRAQAEEYGCTAFLWKPFSGETILSILASLTRPSHA